MVISMANIGIFHTKSRMELQAHVKLQLSCTGNIFMLKPVYQVAKNVLLWVINKSM